MAAKPIDFVPDEAQQFTRCRASWQRHRWDDAPAPPRGTFDVPRGWVTVSFRCERCGLRKTYLCDPRTGETSRPYYSHRPRGYRAPGTTNADWKVLFVQQYVRNGGKR